jgi:hypothetical protein
MGRPRDARFERAAADGWAESQVGIADVTQQRDFA